MFTSTLQVLTQHTQKLIMLKKAGKKTYQRINLETKELLVNNKLT